MARATGFSHSRGDYIYFLDSDDFIHPQTLEMHLQAVVQTESDLSVAPFTIVSHHRVEMEDYSSRFSEDELVEKEGLVAIFSFLFQAEYEGVYPTTATGKLYKRHLFKDFDWLAVNYKQYEDNFFSAQLYSRMQKMSILKDRPFYYYRCNHKDDVLSRVNKPNDLNGRKLGKIETFDELAMYRRKIVKALPLDEKEREKLLEAIAHLRLGEMLHRGVETILADEFLVEDIKYIKEMWEYNNQLKDNEINRLNELVSSYRAEIDHRRDEVAHLTNSFNGLINSKSYKLTKPLRLLMVIVRHPVESLRKIKQKLGR